MSQCLLQEYESLAQRLNAVFVDEENPLVESGEEERLSMAIHSELDELMHCIQDMKARPSLSRAQQTRVSRFYEIHFDHSREWQKISVCDPLLSCVLSSLTSLNLFIGDYTA